MRASRLILPLVLALAAPMARAESLHVAARIPIGGEGGWDLLAVDTLRNHVFVTHGTRVEVVNPDSGRVVGVIDNTPGVHGVALAPELGCGFTSNGRDSSVTVFDLASLAVLGRIGIPARNPDVILYDSFTRRVFTMNGGSASATAIDARTRQVLATVPLGGRPEFAVSDGAGRLFINLEDSSAVEALDARRLAVVARWPLAPGEEPTGIAFDLAHHRLFSACSNQKLIVLDSRSGRRVAELPIGRGVDGAAYDARRGLIYTSNGADSSVSVIHEDAPDRFTSLDAVATERGARTVALDESSGALYLPTADFGPPPAPTPERPNPRPAILPGTFRLLVLSR